MSLEAKHYPDVTEADVINEQRNNYPLYLIIALLSAILTVAIAITAFDYIKEGYGLAGYVITGTALWGMSIFLLPILAILGIIWFVIILKIVFRIGGMR